MKELYTTQAQLTPTRTVETRYQHRTVTKDRSQHTRPSITERLQTPCLASSPALLWLRPTKLLEGLMAEARLAAPVGPAQLMVQPSRIAARLFQRRDERRTSRRWREARRPSPSPRHEHTARRRNPNKERRAAMLVVASNEPVAYTCTYCMWNNVRFPLLGFRVWRFPQGGKTFSNRTLSGHFARL